MIATTPRLLRGTDLRYTLTRLLQLHGPATIAELIAMLNAEGFTVAGRPSKTVSDALRWEVGRGRVWRIGRSRYRAGDVPRGTQHRIIKRVRQLIGEVLSLRGGQSETQLGFDVLDARVGQR